MMENTSLFGKITALLSAIGCLILAMFAGSIFEHVDAGDILVVQSLSGTLSVHTDPGWKYQGFGKVTHLRKSSQLWFHNDKNEPGNAPIKVRFNDGGHADISGSVRVDLPVDAKSVLDLFTHYNTQEAIQRELIRTVVEKSIYMTGPLMSSKESYSERRNDLITFIEDQATHGVYQTTTKAVKGIDPVSGVDRTMTVVDVRKGENGTFLRQEESPLQRFNIRMYNLSLNSIDYDPIVEKQIASQQEAIMQVQTAIANAKRAEQAAYTAEKEGQAAAATAKWKQEVIKAQVVTEAQQKLEVAKLEKDAAEQTKQRDILVGQGIAEAKKLQMEANGALDPKLDAWIQVNGLYARALAEIKQPIVPSVVMGSGTQASGAVDLIEMLKVRTAQQLALDIGMQKR